MKKIYLSLIVLAFALTLGCNDNSTGNAVKNSDLGEENANSVSIPITELSTTARFYSYNDNGVNVNYFGVLGSNGEPRVAFDACDVCGGSMGYTQEGTDIKCDKCGRVFTIDGLGTKNKGYGCWPSYLPHSVDGDQIIIKKSDLESGRHRFS